MANRIKGITVEIGGDVTKLDKALGTVDASLRRVSGDLRDVERQLKLDPTNVELLAAKSELLAKKQALAADRVQVLENAKKSLDKNLDPDKLEAFNLELALSKSRANEAAKAVDDFDPSLGSLTNSASNASGGMDGVLSAAKSMGEQFGLTKALAAGLATGGLLLVVDGAKQLVEWLSNLDAATEEYRINMGKLNTAYESAGYSTETAQEAYRGFYEILGDTNSATEASQQLAQLAQDEADVAEWTKIAAGVYGTFGDSLPIEGLIEAANETAKTGKVTGQLADALNWVGISEDEVNGNLSLMSTELQRSKYLMSILAEQYDAASESFYRNNETLIESRNVQADMDEATAKLGQTVADLKNKFFEAFGPLLLDLLELAGDGLDGLAILINGIADALDWLGEKISGVINWFKELLGLSGQTDGTEFPANPGSQPRILLPSGDDFSPVPGFATGGVFAPNNPMLGVLGDNKTEYEVAAPESMLRETFLDALAQSGLSGGSGGGSTATPTTLNLILDGQTFARLFLPYLKGENVRLGIDILNR